MSWLAVAVVFSAAPAGVLASWLRPQSTSSHQVMAAAMPAAVAPRIPIETATEGEIAAHTPTSLTVFRLYANPRILVLDFASLRQQGMTLNRVAAFTEKRGMPHDRVLNDSELNDAIRERGDTAETFYLGHDYAAASLRRFFVLADQEGIELNRSEGTLRALLRQEGLLSRGIAGALISVPAVGVSPRITVAGRRAILRHELSHGEFFSNPSYANYVRKFWRTALTEDEQGAVRSFLAKEGYDPREEELMINEMQAYLMFTRDPAFFTPGRVGMTEQRLHALQMQFLAGMPPGWLRNVLASYGGGTQRR